MPESRELRAPLARPFGQAERRLDGSMARSGPVALSAVRLARWPVASWPVLSPRHRQTFATDVAARLAQVSATPRSRSVAPAFDSPPRVPVSLGQTPPGQLACQASSPLF